MFHLRYDIALLYLAQAGYDLDNAIQAYLADEQWEMDHPINKSSRGKLNQSTRRRKFGFGTSFNGQI